MSLFAGSGSPFKIRSFFLYLEILARIFSDSDKWYDIFIDIEKHANINRDAKLHIRKHSIVL